MVIFFHSADVNFYFKILAGKIEARDAFYDILSKKDETLEEAFKYLSVFEKNRLLSIYQDDYLSFLYELVCIRKPVLTKDEFWNYAKKKYIHKFNFLKTLQAVQLSSIYLANIRA
jgi:hypothetical protein